MEANDYESQVLRLLMNPHYQLWLNRETLYFQFVQWTGRLFYLNEALHREFDSFYQELFVVKLYELLTVGVEYLEMEMLPNLSGERIFQKRWVERLYNGLKGLRSRFTETEFAYLEYRRHNSCHIFQTGYEVIDKQHRIKPPQQQHRTVMHPDGSKHRVPLINLEMDFQQLLRQYGSEEGVDAHFRAMLYPVLSTMHADLQAIHEEEQRAQSSRME